MAKVGVIMGSSSDFDHMRDAITVLGELGVVCRPALGREYLQACFLVKAVGSKTVNGFSWEDHGTSGKNDLSARMDSLRIRSVLIGLNYAGMDWHYPQMIF